MILFNVNRNAIRIMDRSGNIKCENHALFFNKGFFFFFFCNFFFNLNLIFQLYEQNK